MVDEWVAFIRPHDLLKSHLLCSVVFWRGLAWRIMNTCRSKWWDVQQWTTDWVWSVNHWNTTECRQKLAMSLGRETKVWANYFGGELWRMELVWARSCTRTCTRHSESFPCHSPIDLCTSRAQTSDSRSCICTGARYSLRSLCPPSKWSSERTDWSLTVLQFW